MLFLDSFACQMGIVARVTAIVSEQTHFAKIAALLFLFEAALTSFIIYRVPCELLLLLLQLLLLLLLLLL